jgi:hypothetical protein
MTSAKATARPVAPMLVMGTIVLLFLLGMVTQSYAFSIISSQSSTSTSSSSIITSSSSSSSTTPSNNNNNNVLQPYHPSFQLFATIVSPFDDSASSSSSSATNTNTDDDLESSSSATTTTTAATKLVGPLDLTWENVELVLDEMRPYLIQDGGNVRSWDIYIYKQTHTCCGLVVIT